MGPTRAEVGMTRAVGVLSDAGLDENEMCLNGTCVAVGVVEDEDEYMGDATERVNVGKWRDPICEKR